MPAPIEQLLSRTVFNTDGVTTTWDFSFSGGYLDKAHVKAYIETPAGARTDVTLTLGMFSGPYQLLISPALAAGDTLTIYRDTPKDLPLVDFVDEGGLSEIALDTMAKQSIFVAAETVDTVNTSPAQAADASAVAAAGSAVAAAGSAVAAAASAALATTYTVEEAVNAAPAKAVPVDADLLPLVDSAAGFTLKQLTWANIKAALSGVFVTLATLASNAGAGIVGLIAAGAGAVPTTVQAKLRESVSVKDFGAVGDGVTDDSAAFQAAVNAAIAGYGEVFVPGGDYLIGTSVAFGSAGAYTGGVKIRGVAPNSVGKRSRIIQKDVNVPVFTIDSITTHMTGLTFTCWAGNAKISGGENIVATAYTANSITLSGNPWAGGSPVIWTPTTPYVATDTTPYANVIRFNLQGAWVGSSVTNNGNGTYTINNVKGADGTVNASISGVVGNPVTFISLAHSIGSAGFTNSTTGMIFCDLRENQFWDHLWFNQITRAFSFDATGSGSGAAVGVGNAGFFSDIVVDQGQSFVWSAGDINAGQFTNCQMYGVLIPFHAPYGNISSNNFSNCKFISSKFAQANTNFIGNTVTGCSFNEITGYGYSDLLVNVGGTLQDSTFVGNNFGRSASIVFNVANISGVSFVGNNILSNGEGGAAYFIYCAGTVLSSRFSENNFAALYGSNSNRLQTSSSTASLAGSVFGDDFINYSNNTGPEIKSFGTWAPSLGGTATYTIQDGNYHRVGKLVFLRAKLVVNAIGTGSSSVVTGLPFPIDNTTNSVQFFGSVGYFSGLATPVVSLVASATNNTSQIQFNGLAAAGATMSASMGVFTSGTRVDFSIVYQTP